MVGFQVFSEGFQKKRGGSNKWRGGDLVICVWFMYRVGDQVSFCNGPKNDEYYYKFQQVIAISREFFASHAHHHQAFDWLIQVRVSRIKTLNLNKKDQY